MGETRTRDNIIFAAILILAVAGNMLTNKNSIIVDIFTIAYGLLILKFFKDDAFKDKLYFLTILFSLLSFTFLFKVKGRYDIYFYFLTVFVYLLYMLKDFRNYNIKELIKNKYVIFLLIFIAYMMMSLLWSADKKLAVKSILNYCIMISLMVVVIDYNRKPGNLEKTIKYIYSMIPAIAVIGLIEITGFRFNIRNHYIDENLYHLNPGFLKKIPTVFFYSPNNYGVFIVLAMTFLFAAMMYTTSRRKRIVSGVLYLMLQINLIFTTSRTAWISLFIIYVFGAVFFAVYKRKRELTWTLGVSLLTLAVFYLISLIPPMWPYYGKFYGTTVPQYGETGSTNVRFTLIVNILEGVILNGNFLGFGAGNVAIYLKNMNNTNGITNPHSLWFEILGDFGLPIFILFCIMYLFIMYELKNIYLKRSSGSLYIVSLLFCFFGFAFLSFAPSSVISFTSFWILMGLGLSAVNSGEEYGNENIDTGKLVP